MVDYFGGLFGTPVPTAPSLCAPLMPSMPRSPTQRHVGTGSQPILFALALVLRGGLVTPAHDD